MKTKRYYMTIPWLMTNNICNIKSKSVHSQFLPDHLYQSHDRAPYFHLLLDREGCSGIYSKTHVSQITKQE